MCCLLFSTCRQGGGSAETEVPQLMYTVPSDAVGVMNFEKGVSSMREVLDSNSVFLTLNYGTLARVPMTLSFNYTGRLHQLLAVDCGKTVPDSLESALNLKASADSAGLKCRFVSLRGGECNAVLISRSDNVLDAARLHISQGASILDAGGVKQALDVAGGGWNSLLFPNREASKLPLEGKYVPFVKGFAEWTVISERKSGDFDVHCVHDSDKSYYAALLDTQKNSDSRLAELILPEIDNIVSLQINSIRDYLGAYREYLDAHTLLRRFEENCREAEAWALNAKVREVAVMSGADCGYLALRCSCGSIPDGIQPNPISGYPSQLFGKAFSLKDEGFCTRIGDWLLIGSQPDLVKYRPCGAEPCPLGQLWPEDGVKAVVYVTEPWPVLIEVNGNTTMKLKKCK